MRADRRHCLHRLVATTLVASGVATTLPARADGGGEPPVELGQALPGARRRGAGTLRFFGLRIYEARLWSPAPITGEGIDQALALELIYARDLVGEQIASRSLKEMQGIGSLSEAQATRWLQLMKQLFPDVRDGDRLTGVKRPGQPVRFFLNGSLRGEIADADFGRLFFGIWLSPRSSEPQLRAQLLGGSS